MAKLKPYNKEHDGSEINEGNCVELIGCTPMELCTFTGVHAYIAPEELRGLTVRGRYPAPNVALFTDDLRLIITIHIDEGYIFNELIICQVEGRSIGLMMLCRQLEETLAESFMSVKLEAAREVNDGISLIGYLIWAKYGFLMDENDLPMFEQLAKEYNDGLPLEAVRVSSLHELLATQEGRQFWQTYGESWFGTFELEKGSDSWKILLEYKKKKGLWLFAQPPESF